jgi:hypothetical protein
MNKRGWMMLRVLINRFNPKAESALLKFLPKEQAEAVMNQEISSTDLAPILQEPQHSLSKIHYSWIQPFLRKFPESLQPIAIASLTPEQIGGMKITMPASVSDIAKSFILNRLYDQMEIQEHFPFEYLPTTELSSLAASNKTEIVELIDFLGLYDLAAEVRKIVNRDHLKNIYTSLTPKEFQFLKICLHQKEQLVSPKLEIDPTKQDSPKLKQIVHKRGLQRLSKALCGQHPDLVWHMAHTLDMGRGNILLTEFQPKEIPKVTKILKQQVLNLINYLQSE